MVDALNMVSSSSLVNSPYSPPSAPTTVAPAATMAQTTQAVLDIGAASRQQPTVDDERQRAESARRNPASQTAEPGIKFEYKDGHRVMSVHDSKGVLIYQVPPKGQLQLVIEQEKRASMVETSA